MNMNKWLRDKLGPRTDRRQFITIKPLYLDRIMVLCPECNAGGIWAVPEGFRIAIAGRLLVTCPNGHIWGISGAWVEEKIEEGNHDDR